MRILSVVSVCDTNSLIAKREDVATSTGAFTVFKSAKDNGKVQVQPALIVCLRPSPCFAGWFHPAGFTLCFAQTRIIFLELGSIARNFLASPSSFNYRWKLGKTHCVDLLLY